MTFVVEQDELVRPVGTALAGTVLAEARPGDLADEIEQARGLRSGRVVEGERHGRNSALEEGDSEGERSHEHGWRASKNGANLLDGEEVECCNARVRARSARSKHALRARAHSNNTLGQALCCPRRTVACGRLVADGTAVAAPAPHGGSSGGATGPEAVRPAVHNAELGLSGRCSLRQPRQIPRHSVQTDRHGLPAPMAPEVNRSGPLVSV
jgi:hypothetical protein